MKSISSKQRWLRSHSSARQSYQVVEDRCIDSAWRDSKDIAYYQTFAQQIEYPDVNSIGNPTSSAIPLPLTMKNPSELPAWDLTLHEAVSTALQSSDVLRSLGGSIVQAPITGAATPTGQRSSIQGSPSQPLGGIEALCQHSIANGHAVVLAKE